MGMWDNEDSNEEFRDIPEEAQTKTPQQVQQQMIAQTMPQAYRPSNVPAEPVTAKPQRPPANQIAFNGATSRFEEPPSDNYVEEVLEELESGEEDYTAILQDANLRIEQGRLYQMIMNHNLFENMDADPRAVENVQREIRKYARERMEIMLGMRQEQVQQPTVVSSPFNDLEVTMLKMVASKASNGATERPEANVIAEAVRETPRRQTLNSIGGSTGAKPQVKPKIGTAIPKTSTPQKVLPKTPAKPVVRTKNDVVIDQIIAEEGVSREDLELEYRGIGKQLHELSAEELTKRQKETAARIAKRRTVKSSQALPMATDAQQEMLAVQHAQQLGQVTGMSALIERVKNMPVKN